MRKLCLVLLTTILVACSNNDALNVQVEKNESKPIILGTDVYVIIDNKADERTLEAMTRAAREAGERFGFEIKVIQPTGADDLVKQINSLKGITGIGGAVIAAKGVPAGEAIAELASTGIPIVGIGTNSAAVLPYGGIGFVGVTDEGIGKAIALKFKALGLKKLICVATQGKDSEREQRICGSVADYLSGVETVSVKVTNKNSPEILRKAIAGDKEIDCMLVMNTALMSTVNQTRGLITRDLSVGLIGYEESREREVRSGELLFMTDNQDAMQARYAVDMLGTFTTTAGIIGNGTPVLTGPDIVTAAKVDAVSLSRKDFNR